MLSTLVNMHTVQKSREAIVSNDGGKRPDDPAEYEHDEDRAFWSSK